MEIIFLEINEYFKKYPKNLKFINDIYIKTGNYDGDLLGNNLFNFYNRYICTNNKSYIICTKDVKSNYFFVNTIYTIEKYRKQGNAKNIINFFDGKNVGFIFDTFTYELKKLLESIGAKKINLYNGSTGRNQFIYEVSGIYKPENEYIKKFK